MIETKDPFFDFLIVIILTLIFIWITILAIENLSPERLSFYFISQPFRLG